MKILLTEQERKMLLAAAMSYRQCDKESFEYHGVTISDYGKIDSKMVRYWNAVIAKLKSAK